eukprot:COSAG02_NODE_49071_length_329_cov_0.895652_1_plen_21_part_01
MWRALRVGFSSMDSRLLVAGA